MSERYVTTEEECRQGDWLKAMKNCPMCGLLGCMTCVKMYRTELQQLREQDAAHLEYISHLHNEISEAQRATYSLTAQLAEAQASKAKLAQLNESLSNSNDECWLENAKLTAQLKSARDALKAAAAVLGDSRERHLARCPGYFFLPNRDEPELSRSCTCGLDAALAQPSGEDV